MSKGHNKVDRMASTLSLPVGEYEYRDRISTGSKKHVFATLSDPDECNPKFAFGKHSDIPKAILSVSLPTFYLTFLYKAFLFLTCCPRMITPLG